MPGLSQQYGNEAFFHRFLSGDEAAFEEIYYDHVQSLLQTATHKLGSAERAKEIVQEVFVKLFLARNEIKHFDNIGGYLHTVLKRKIINVIRDDMAHMRHHQIYSRSQKTIESSTSEYTEHKELDKRILVALSGLAPQCKQAFILSRYENLSYKEIADKMGLSVKTIEMHISRALSVLRSELKDYQFVLLVLVPAAIA